MCPETCEQLINGFQQSDFFPKNEMHGGRSAVSAEKHILSFLWLVQHKTVPFNNYNCIKIYIIYLYILQVCRKQIIDARRSRSIRYSYFNLRNDFIKGYELSFKHSERCYKVSQ